MAPRLKGSGLVGSTRSLRLPHQLDQWFEERLALRSDKSSSDLLVELVHGGLRLRPRYMAIHRRELERLIAADDRMGYRTYLRALVDTFGKNYADHLAKWLQADGFVPLE